MSVKIFKLVVPSPSQTIGYSAPVSRNGRKFRAVWFTEHILKQPYWQDFKSALSIPLLDYHIVLQLNLAANIGLSSGTVLSVSLFEYSTFEMYQLTPAKDTWVNWPTGGPRLIRGQGTPCAVGFYQEVMEAAVPLRRLTYDELLIKLRAQKI
jgi:hypothetical protein